MERLHDLPAGTGVVRNFDGEGIPAWRVPDVVAEPEPEAEQRVRGRGKIQNGGNERGDAVVDVGFAEGGAPCRIASHVALDTGRRMVVVRLHRRTDRGVADPRDDECGLGVGA